MSGSRSNTPNYGGKSSLDQLNRTIEGLEARIQGLVSERKQAQARPVPADPLGEIMERQRALGGARERVAAAIERAPRQETDRHGYRAEPERRQQAEAMGEIAAALSALRAELKHGLNDVVGRDLADIRSDLRNLQAGAGNSAALHDQLARLSESIALLDGSGRHDATLDLRADLDELRSMTANLAREESLRGLERRWDRVEKSLSSFDPEALREEIVQLAWRIDGIKSDLGEFGGAPAIRSLEDKLIAVATAIEALGRNVEKRSDVSGHFAGLEKRLDEISRAIAATASQSASALDNATLRRLESRIGELAVHVDSLGQSNPESDIAERIDALAQRIEDIASEDAAQKLEERIGQLSALVERNFRTGQPADDVSHHLEHISRKLDGLGEGSAGALMERLERLSRQIEEIERPAEAAPIAMADLTAMSRLETRLTDIASRLDESASAPPADTAALKNLEHQIANLSSLLSQPGSVPAAAAMPNDFAQRMAAIEEYMASSDEFIVEAARQAAEAVVEAYSRSGIAAGQANPAEISALAGLAEDLRALEAHTRSSEERTAETFAALHETLVQIAGRLDEFGSERRAPIEREAFRPADVPIPSMPKVAQPEFARAQPGEAETPARFIPAEEPARRLPENPKVEVLQEPGLMEDAAEADIALDTAAMESVARREKPASKSLIAGLAAKLRPVKKEKAASGRVAVDPAPALDAGEMLVADEMGPAIEPAAVVPDVKKIMERVRAGQKGAGAAAMPVGGQADLIAAARRAAQAAAQETGQQKPAQPAAKSKAKPQKPGTAGGGQSEVRRPILLAAAAVLLVVMSYPLVSNLIGSRQAVIEETAQPVTAEPAQTETASDTAAKRETTLDADSAGAADHAKTDALPESVPAKIETGADQLMAPADDASEAVPLTEPGADEPAKAVEAQDAELPAADQPAMLAETKDRSVDLANAVPSEVQVPAGLQPAALAEAAKKGDPLAYFEIGSRYAEGRGVKVDLTEAGKWYQLAADRGLAPAEYRLANFYEKGTGVTRDLEKAKALYLSAAEKGNSSAMHNLAVLYATGAAGGPDFSEAARWFKQAAELNVRDSQFNLAILYARGNGMPQDLEESYKWFGVAAKQGDQDAAQKRDEVANALKPDQLKSAKAKLDLWKPEPLDDKANNALVPDAWIGKSNTTASVDMKRAIRNIQAILNNNGFDAGKPDGEMGRKTVEAIKAFQKAVGQEPTGKITDALVKELLKRNKKA